MFSFTLPDEFVSEYASRRPDWGFPDAAGNALGEITFIRSYSRVKGDGTKERWHEVCRRVIEGMFSIQKDHCAENRLPWSDTQALKAAKEAYERMFTFKWLPPGRGIWMMGTEYVNGSSKNSAALQNCSFVSTADIDADDPAEPFVFLMEASMLGIGVGFDTLGGYRGLVIHAPDPARTRTFVVPDSREGWVESVSLILNSYLKPGQPAWRFDYSEVRPAGEPIRGFGGTASGPDPLIRLHEAIVDLFDSRAGEQLSTIDIVDIANLIGVCVVAGNVRRSAEIALGLPSDQDFVDAKNPERFPKRNSYDPAQPGWGWMSNNSLSVKVGTDYTPFVDNIVANGEPGFVWNDLARAYGRMADEQTNADWRVMGTNPCVTADTWTLTGDGARKVSDLVGVPFEALVDGVPHRSSGFFATGVKPTVRLETSEGYSLTLTEDHRVMTPSGWRPAGELSPGDQVTLSDHASANWSGEGTEDEGYVLGHLVGDGTFTSNGAACVSVWEDGPVADQLLRIISDMPHDSSFRGWSRSGEQKRLGTKALTDLAARFGIARGSKTISTEVERASRAFSVGFLRGLFDADGHVEGSSTGPGISVSLSQSDRKALEAAQRMLIRLGVRSKISSGHPERLMEMPGGVYRTKGALRLVISGSHTERFMRTVGFSDPAKADLWEADEPGMASGFYDKPHVATVAAVAPAGEREVFDAQVADANAFCANGVFVHNCGEMNLESFEMCTLVEAFLHRHDTLDDFLRTLKFAYLYAKTVTLVPTHWPKTNAVMQRNRRIGCSISGIASFLDAYGEDELVAWMEAGYGEIGHWDKVYAEWLCVRESIKRSTVKPSGSVSIVAGSTPGVHWSPGGEFFLRTIRFGVNDPMVPLFVRAGYRVEDDVVSAGTKVVYFPIHAEVSRSERDVTIEEKISLAALSQKHWSDNSVSVTVSFDSESESGKVAGVLEDFEGKLKSVSFLPMGNQVYPQQPYTQITRDEYEAYLGTIQPVTFDPVYEGTSGNIEAEGEAYCSTDVCEIPSMRTPGAAEFEDADSDAGRKPADRPSA